MFDLRYSREIVLKEISEEGYGKLHKSRVCVVGLGATGSPVAQLFARAGIGYLRIIDGDTVDLTNLHRQLLYDEHDVGKSKAESARSHLSRINSKCVVEEYDTFLDAGNIESLLKGCDIIIDGTDRMEPRRLINEYAVKHKIPWVFVSSIGTVAQVKAVIPGRTSCLECFTDPQENYPMSCEDTGVLASAPVIASSMAWTRAVRILLGKGDDGEMYYLDEWNGIFEKIRIGRNPSCRTCSKMELLNTND